MPQNKSFINDRNLAILTVILWALVFVVYAINTSDTTIGNMSPPFAYSIIWWAIVLILFVVWSIIDLTRGER
ncbi:MAG TPA: hypothetical protein ENF25_03795 [Thermoprotei archaeon]|nr:MAG: hypothetical protein DRN26_03830 [Thermoplasmata archaeon]HDJ51303.1 hypothetical protein [Thermoprotei archaeon]